jgi:hypothetical protein
VAKVASFPVLAKAAKTSPEGHGSRFSSPKSDGLVEIHGGLTKNKIVLYNPQIMGLSRKIAVSLVQAGISPYQANR